ncbi:four helix bundle protein [Aquimarina sp. MAR_2010_214]|uniref:four helix bundle protein n=1 Tax=Aquimarina sp. MAR_2010_214 TaxID=1250026 RepID=UPI000C70E3A1|nr:four helix bundle protein [Aquimarina sp. MAR_2010_214]PKV48411.1 four helix bundle protein [Aquimarina sp. MAR_2010_214]
MRNFRELKVWEKSHELCLLVYEITKKFPEEEKYGLISQIRRASSSVPTNISEGCGYDSDKNFVRFLGIASGSASEVEYLLFLSKDLRFVSHDNYKELLECIISIKKMIYGLIKSFR